MTIHNAQIANLFNRYATLLEIKGDNPFRVRAYRNAARTVENLPNDVGDMLHEGFDLTELPGIGDDLAHKLADIVATEKFADLESIEKKLPAALVDLTSVPGLGPKRIKTLYDTLKIRSREDLARAVHAGKLKGVRGFGPKFEQVVLKAVETAPPAEHRLLLAEAEQTANPLLKHLRALPGVQLAAIAGSYRRRKETVGDLDVLVCSINAKAVMKHFLAYEEIAKTLAEGPTRASVKLKSGLQIDLRVIAKASAGAALVYFTGSKAHNIAIRTLGKKRGLKFNEYGVFRKNKRVAGETESAVYAQIGLPLIPPELRENQGEIEAAREGRLPHLIELNDIKGDLHVHTKASDGNATIAEMAEAARALGYRYIAIADHASRIGIVHGLDAKRLARQMGEIDKLNSKLSGFAILKSAEVDIRPDGSLDLDDDILSELDIVTASIHAKFDLDANAQTERLIRAMDHKPVNVIGHPTGRLIGEREPYALDMKRLAAAAKERGCFLEINAQPKRLDLSDVHARLAKEMGLKLAICTDAHSPETLGCMRFGIDQARRGWIEAGDVINTLSLAALRKTIKR